MDAAPTRTLSALVIRVGARLCALRVEDVVETMRPLPIAPMPGAPPFVEGLAVVRGEAVPVLDVARFLDEAAGPVGRFVLVRAGDRRVVLAVAAVIGLRALEGDALRALPPLLSAAAAERATAVGRLDDELLLVLDAGRLVPDGGEGPP